MNFELLRDRLGSYQFRNSREEEQAVREITQELILAGLSRTDLFSRAAFQGGTCLRIVHGAPRFLDDLDFALFGPNPAFRWDAYGKAVSRELSAYGYKIEVKEGRAEDGRAVKNTILRDDAITKLLNFEYLGKAGVPKKVQTKLEVDTNPPEGAWHDRAELNFPY
jgi:predicted nucleotidyltransferase component of viral defense system